MTVPVLSLDGILIAPVQTELSDEGWVRLREDLLRKVGDRKASGAVLDLSGLELVDSYAGRVLVGIAQALSLRGAHTVIAGLHPDVAFTMVHLGMDLRGIETALDLEDAYVRLRRRRRQAGRGHG